MNLHLHKYKLECNLSGGHKHKLTGYTDNMVGIKSLHFHYFFGISSYSGHTHYYSGFTSLPVKTENGHVHKIEGILELNDTHEHPYAGYTYEDTAYIPRHIMREAFI